MCQKGLAGSAGQRVGQGGLDPRVRPIPQEGELWGSGHGKGQALAPQGSDRPPELLVHRDEGISNYAHLRRRWP